MKIIKRSALIFLGIFLSILVIEIILQISSFIVNKKIILNKNKYNIVCFGDSFTFGLGAETKNGSYPEQLKNILNNNNILNEGIPGNNSTIVHNRIKKFFSNNSADILILLTGINNYWNTEGFEKYDFLSYFKTYKLIKLIYARFFNKPDIKINNRTLKEKPLYNYKIYEKILNKFDIEYYFNFSHILNPDQYSLLKYLKIDKTIAKNEKLSFIYSSYKINDNSLNKKNKLDILKNFQDNFPKSSYNYVLKYLFSKNINILKESLVNISRNLNYETLKIYSLHDLCKYYIKNNEDKKAESLINKYFSKNDLIYSYILTDSYINAHKFKEASEIFIKNSILQNLPKISIFKNIYYDNNYKNYCLSIFNIVFNDKDSFIFDIALKYYKKKQINKCLSFLIPFYYRYPYYVKLWKTIKNISNIDNLKNFKCHNILDHYILKDNGYTNNNNNFLTQKHLNYLNNIKDNFKSAISYKKQFEYEKAIISLKNIKPENTEILVEINNIETILINDLNKYNNWDNKDKFIKLSKKLEPLLKNNIEYLNSIAKLYSTIGKWKKACIYYEKILKINPDNFVILDILGELYSQHNIKKALKYFKKAFIITNNFQLYFSKIQYCVKHENEKNKLIEQARNILKTSNNKKELLTFKNIIKFCKNDNYVAKTLKNDIIKISNLCKKNNCKLIIQTYPFKISINTVIKELALKNNIPLVDNEKIFLKKADQTYYIADLHCNNKGYKLMAKNIKAIINKLSE